MLRDEFFANGEASSQVPPSFLDMSYEVREMIYLGALKPIPTRVHLQQGRIRLWSLVPNFNPREIMTVPPLFVVSKQIHTETTRIFFEHTKLVFRPEKLREPLVQTLDCIPIAARLHVRTIDLHMGK
jgi:hypothetical protein